MMRVVMLNISPPTPEPDAAMPAASARFFENLIDILGSLKLWARGCLTTETAEVWWVP